MKRLQKLRSLLFLGAMSACQARPAAAPDERVDEHAASGPAFAEEVSLSAETIALLEIRIGTAEKRALAGGVGIPAEVQFDPSGTAHVRPLVPGRITRVAAELGDAVKRGQVLGVLASTDVSSARSRLGQARAKLAAAESTQRRQEQLSREGIGAQRALIDAEAQVRELRAEVEGLERQLSVFGSGHAGELSLASPIDGVVVDVHATLGETAVPEQAAFVVIDPSKVWIRGDVPELSLSRVQLGSRVIARLAAYPELAMAGTISYVAPALDERTRSLPIRATLEAPDPRLRGGLYGSLELVGGPHDERVLCVPAQAVATLFGQSVVFVPGSAAGRFRVQPVVLGRRAGGLFEVRAGLAEHQQLAVSGAFSLKSVLRSAELAEGHED